MDERTTDPPVGDAAPPQPPLPHSGDDGKQVYDQEFFLALARRGKDEWNRWRESNPGAYVKLNGIDFRKIGRAIDFSGFQFGDGADLSGATFGDSATFSGTAFGNQADLSRTTFGLRAEFSGSSFGDKANLSEATFGRDADFSAATFGDEADLSKATFEGHADLASVTFGVRANLAHVAFGERVDLSNATFEYLADFSQAAFGDFADLSGASFGGLAKFDKAVFGIWANFSARSFEDWLRSREQMIEASSTLQSWPKVRKKAFLEFSDILRRRGQAPDALLAMTFARAIFTDVVHYSRRDFKASCVFDGARFEQPPIFADCKGLERLDFYGASIGFSGTHPAIFGWSPFPERGTPGWTTDSDIALRLRALRTLAETTKNHDFERDLYVEERKAERGILLAHYWRNGWRSLLKPKLFSHCLWMGIMAAYSMLADYGRSFVRPLAWLAISVPLFWWAYASVLIPPTNPAKLADFRRATWAFAISNAVPFVGALTLERDVKLTLLCGDRPIDAQHAQASGQPICVPIPGRRFQLLALAQSIFSALCIFFAGLALRNYFKLR